MATNPDFLGQYATFHNIIIRSLSFGMNDLRAATEGEPARQGYEAEANEFIGLLYILRDLANEYKAQDFKPLLDEAINIISNRYGDASHGSHEQRSDHPVDSGDGRDSTSDHSEAD